MNSKSVSLYCVMYSRVIGPDAMTFTVWLISPQRAFRMSITVIAWKMRQSVVCFMNQSRGTITAV